MKNLLKIIFITGSCISTTSVAQIEYRYGLGLQVTNPTYGLSGKTNLTDRISAEMIIGPIAKRSALGLKGSYGITKDKFIHSYAYGLTGMRFGNTSINGLLGVGIGVEHNWQQWDAKLPPIWFNLELGAGFEHTVKPVIGIGAHYWFNP